MIMNKNHLLLFSPFFREVGKKRKVVHNLSEWIAEIDKLNGYDDVFTSVYPLDGTIDKIFFDIDDKYDIEKAFVVAADLYKYLMSNKFTAIPIATGKKGFQIHVLLEPRSYSNLDIRKKKLLLANAAYYILEEAGIIENGAIPPQIDTHVIGDIRRLCRVPNTLRPPENKSYCVFLPPDFYLYNVDEVVELTKQTSSEYNYKIQNLPTLYDFPHVLSEERKREFIKIDEARSRAPENIKEYLKRLLRPCLFEEIIKPEPLHHARVATTIDLLYLGYSPSEIADIYSKLGWVDFDYDKTFYQIYQIQKGGYKPYSCKKLRALFGDEYCKRCV